MIAVAVGWFAGAVLVLYVFTLRAARRAEAEAERLARELAEDRRAARELLSPIVEAVVEGTRCTGTTAWDRAGWLRYVADLTPNPGLAHWCVNLARALDACADRGAVDVLLEEVGSLDLAALEPRSSEEDPPPEHPGGAPCEPHLS